MAAGGPVNCRFAISTCRFRSTAETSFEPVAETKATELSGKITTCSGWEATVIVASEASVAASKISTVESSRLGTTICLPSGVTRASQGRLPVRARPTICPVLQSMATRVAEPEAATKARFPSFEKSSAKGDSPTGMRARIWPFDASMANANPPSVETPQT